MGITIVVGGVAINRWGYHASETGHRSNVTINDGTGFICVSEDNETQQFTFDVHMGGCAPGLDPQAYMYAQYDRLEQVLGMANRGMGHLQYKYDYGTGYRMWELLGGSINEKDQLYKYSRRGGTIVAEVNITVRRSISPTMMLTPARVVPANAASTVSGWASDEFEAILVGPDTTADTQWRTATNLASISILDEIANTGYARLVLSGAIVGATLIGQPIYPYPYPVALGSNDLVWSGIAAGDSISGIVIYNSDQGEVVAWIPSTSWWSGNPYDGHVIVPDGSTLKFKVSQWGLVVAP